MENCLGKTLRPFVTGRKSLLSLYIKKYNVEEALNSPNMLPTMLHVHASCIITLQYPIERVFISATWGCAVQVCELSHCHRHKYPEINWDFSGCWRISNVRFDRKTITWDTIFNQNTLYMHCIIIVMYVHVHY